MFLMEPEGLGCRPVCVSSHTAATPYRRAQSRAYSRASNKAFTNGANAELFD
jgi:hypothetical protein